MIDDILKELSRICIARGFRLVTAESCTGGLVAKLITDQAGSSDWFERGFVSYSNLSKQEMMGVPANLLERWGAVSEQVAGAMAKGALQHSAADFSLAITGIAGPAGGSPGKPVGMVCFGWAAGAGKACLTRTIYFEGDRVSVRESAALFALQELLELVKKS